MSLIAAAERLRAEIGAPRFPPTEAALDEALAPARDRDLGRRCSTRPRPPGRAASLDVVVGRHAGLLLGECSRLDRHRVV